MGYAIGPLSIDRVLRYLDTNAVVIPAAIDCDLPLLAPCFGHRFVNRHDVVGVKPAGHTEALELTIQGSTRHMGDDVVSNEVNIGRVEASSRHGFCLHGVVHAKMQTRNGKYGQSAGSS